MKFGSIMNFEKNQRRKFFSVDVTNRDKVLETARKVLTEVGDVTILINNAGIMPQHDMLKHSEQEIRKIFEINVLAHFWMFEGFLLRMIQKNNGHIVALSSMAGQMGIQNLVNYLNWSMKFLIFCFKLNSIIIEIIGRFLIVVQNLPSEE